MRFLLRLRTPFAIIVLLLALGPALRASGGQALDPTEPTTFIRLNQSVPDLRAVRVEDYGSFFWAVVPISELARLDAAGIAYQEYPDAPMVALPGGVFDARRGEPVLAPENRLPDGATGLYIVKLIGPAKPAWLDGLARAGMRVIDYLAPYNYIVWADGPAVQAARGLSYVLWVGGYHPAYKLSLQVRAPREAITGYGVTFYDDGRMDQALAWVQSMGGLVLDLYRVQSGFDRVVPGPYDRSSSLVHATIAIDAARLEDLARLANAYAFSLTPLSASIRDEMSDQIIADNHPGGIPQVGYLAWLAGKGVDGNGVAISNVDTGVNYNHTDINGSGQNRLQACYNYSSGTYPPPACGATPPTCGTHGTMTTGIALGDATSGVSDPQGFKYTLGIAVEARLVVQNFLCGPGGGGSPPPGPYGWRTLGKITEDGGAFVSANSWGPDGTPQGYDAKTREFDFFPRDADPGAVGNEPQLFSLSIMNGGGGTSTQGTPDEGKNLLRIGGSKNYRAGDIDDLCTCTAHGPALDGRRLPDVVAPGQTIYSTSGTSYSSGTGTSFASPHASGAAAIFTQWYSNTHSGAWPSPALVKAAFVVGADDLFGGLDADGVPMGHIPDNKQGWGRLNINNSINPALPTFYYDQATLFQSTGEQWSQTLTVANPAQPMKISLVWTDAPGPGLGGTSPAWVNDLDLVVTQGGTTYLGNVFLNGYSTTGGVADNKNNIENVYIQSASGAYTVRVAAAAIVGDGVPNNGIALDQDFALVCWNCLAGPPPTATPTITPGGPTFTPTPTRTPTATVTPTPLPGCVLLVDDDNDGPNTQSYFTTALNGLAVSYTVFDAGTGAGNGPSLAQLQQHPMVIWFSGDKFGGGGSAGPNAADETNLTGYLNGGGRLFLSSQDYLYDFGLTSFGSTYLGVGAFTNDNNAAATEIFGQAGDPIGGSYGGLGLIYPTDFTSYADTVNPATGASSAFRTAGGANSSTNIDKASGPWKTVFFSTDWVPTANHNPNNARALLNTIITWFGGCGATPTPTPTRTPTPAQFSFTLAPTGLSDIAIALDVTGSGITNAESLADFIEAQGGTPPGSVQQLLKWSASIQNFLAWSHEFQFGDNFAVALGDYVFLITNGGPSAVTFTGRMPNPGELHFNLSPGTPSTCALNFISLPMDQSQITTADQLSDAIGTPSPPGPATVVQTLDWHSGLQNFLVWSNQFNFGDNFTTLVGYPYIVCLTDTAPATWP
jgi:hypothetical protein